MRRSTNMVRYRTAPLVLFVACAPAEVATAGRTVVRNANVVMLAPDAPTAIVSGKTILIDDGSITAIKIPSDEDLRAGDMLVDAGGAWLVPGLIDVVGGGAVPYSEVTRSPMRGVTTLAGHFGPKRIAWYAKLNVEAAIHAPSLVDIPAGDQGPWPSMTVPPEARTPDAVARHLIARTRERAASLGLTDRGAIAIGQRGDLIVVGKNPLEYPDTLAQPIEVVIGGSSMRRSAIETNLKMIAEADAAIAAQPAPGPAEQLYLVESGGLRVGRLVVARDGLRAVDWWGPPVDQTTTWSMTRSAEGSSQWAVQLTQVVQHGFTIEMRLNRQQHETTASAQITAPEKLPLNETTLAATPAEPLLDPVSLVLRMRERIAALEEGTHLDVEVIEPVPEQGKVKVGVRVLRLARIGASSVPVPVEAGERVLRIESRTGVDSASAAVPSEQAVAGWIVIDGSGQPLRASLVAPEGITEYFLSLPQPSPPSEPQVKRP